MADLSEVTPAPRGTGGHAAVSVHKHLRWLILSGKLAPGTIISQVELAPKLGVSRTPLREALRQLQEEGLIKAEPQRRVRVVDFDPGELDSTYAQRIALEAMGVLLTVPELTAPELADLQETAQRVETLGERDDLKAWQEAHREFHLRLVSGAPAELLRAITAQLDRGELYRGLYGANRPRSWTIGNAEHAAIVQYFADGDAEQAAKELGAHLARTALSLMADLAPDYDPRGVRSALALVRGGQTVEQNGARRRSRAKSAH